jgi:hypothetical protein
VGYERACGVTENDAPSCQRAVKSNTAAGIATANPTQRATDHCPSRKTTARITTTTTQNWKTNNGVSFSWSGMALFYKPLAHAVDEIGISRNKSSAPHICGDLTSMIGRMHYHVHQNVIFTAAPGLTLAVAIAY